MQHSMRAALLNPVLKRFPELTLQRGVMELQTASVAMTRCSLPDARIEPQGDVWRTGAVQNSAHEPKARNATRAPCGTVSSALSTTTPQPSKPAMLGSCSRCPYTPCASQR
jgi:hypothetical protein